VFTRTQWYLLTVVRLVCLVVLIVFLGKRVEKMMLPFWAEIAIGAIIVALGTAVGNSWAISYRTYLSDQHQQK
jgi:uncharacterized integral membrane protein